MRIFVSIVLLILMTLPCVAEELPYFEQHGIEIDYIPNIDLNMNARGCVLEYPDPNPDGTVNDTYINKSTVRFDILNDETDGDTRNIEIGMTITELCKIWPSGPLPYNSLAAFGVYDYYTGIQLDIGMNGLTTLIFNEDELSRISCDEMHTTILEDGTEISACVRWGTWDIDEEWNPFYRCIFSFSIPADYDGLVICCMKHERGAEHYAFISENGMPALEEMGEYLHDSVFMRIQ